MLHAILGVIRALIAAYQLKSEKLATDLETWREAQGKLTSDELEGLRYELIAVLVVRHDCDYYSCV